MDDNISQSYSVSLFPRYRVPNKRIALEPFPDDVQPKRVVNGVLMVMARQDTVGLRVVFGNENFLQGHICYVRSDRKSTSTWGKEIREVDGFKFILVPEDEVILVDQNPWLKSEPL